MSHRMHLKTHPGASLLIAAGLALLAQGCGAYIGKDAWERAQERAIRHATEETAESVNALAGGPLSVPPISPDAREVRPAEQGAPAVVLFDEHTVREGGSDAFGHFTLHEVRRAVRLDRRSAVDHARVAIVLGGGDLLHGLVGETLTADGRTVALGEPQTFYLQRPLRAVVVAFPHAEPGSIVRWAYRVRTPGRRAFGAWSAPDVLPVRRTTYRLVMPAEREGRWLAEGLDLDTRKEGSQIIRTWSARDLPYARRQPGDAPGAYGRGSIQFIVTGYPEGFLDPKPGPTIDGWEDLLEGAFGRLLDNPGRTPAALRAAAPGERTLAEAVSRVNARFVDAPTPLPADQDGIEAFELFRRADARNRAEILAALLGVWDHACGFVYTSPAGTPRVEARLPIPTPSPRILLACGEVLLDPGCPGCAPGQIGADVRGRPAMSISGGQRARRVEPLILPDEPSPPMERRYVVEATDRGLVAARGEIVLHGTDAARVRAWLRDNPLPPVEAAEAAAETFLDGIGAESISVSGHDERDGPVRFALDGVLVARHAIAQHPRWSVIALDTVFDEPVLGWAAVEARTRPVTLAAEFGFVNAVQLPASVEREVAHSPEPTVIESPYGTYRLERSPGDDLTLTETLQVKPGVVPIAEWPALRAFLRRVVDQRRASIVLRHR